MPQPHPGPVTLETAPPLKSQSSLHPSEDSLLPSASHCPQPHLFSDLLQTSAGGASCPDACLHLPPDQGLSHCRTQYLVKGKHGAAVQEGPFPRPWRRGHEFSALVTAGPQAGRVVLSVTVWRWWDHGTPVVQQEPSDLISLYVTSTLSSPPKTKLTGADFLLDFFQTTKLSQINPFSLPGYSAFGPFVTAIKNRQVHSYS